jgi:hypothetical protein
MPEILGVPEIYADFVHIATGELGVFLGFRAISPLDLVSPESGQTESQLEMPTALKAIVRLRQENAKMFAIMLRRALKDYEKDFGAIPIPAGFRESVGLTADEW